MVAAFLEDVRFPPEISRGSVGGPDWPAQIVTLDSGYEERNTRISAPRRTYDAKYGVRTHDELYDVLSLYYAAWGRLKGFRWKDWLDYRSGSPLLAPAATDQPIGTGDGATATFQLVKTYSSGSGSFVREISKPVPGSVLVAVDDVEQVEGTAFTVDTATGIVTFIAGHIPAEGAAVTAGFAFDVPVRFDCKMDQAELNGPLADISSIILQELRL
jgi:uncharacterized protein (TIGR02217 family)